MQPATAAPPVPHPDPMPPGRLATWLFLASEVMFFVGLLGVYVIFRSTPANAELFAAHRGSFDATVAGVNTAVLLLSSVAMAVAVDAAWKGRRARAVGGLLAVLLLGGAFLAIKGYEYAAKLTRYTIVATAPPTGTRYAYDGRADRIVRAGDADVTLVGHRAPVGTGFDVHAVAQTDVARLAEGGAEPRGYTIPLAGATWTSYGPWKNVVFASYFALTGAHVAHVLGGLVAVLVLLTRAARGRLKGPAAEYVALYWYFVDGVWVVLFPMLYLM